VRSYLTVARDAEAELEVKRSRFLGTPGRFEAVATARALVDVLRKEHWDARHHCSAWRQLRRGSWTPLSAAAV
jgi:putative IMPACT (imprinted ancient) family translation regulator